MSRLRADSQRLLVPLLLAVVIPIGAGAQTGDELERRREEMRGLRREMEENRKKISELERKEEDLDDLDERLRRDLNLTTRYLSELERQERDLVKDLAERRVELDHRTVEHEKMLRQLRTRLRAYQRSHQPSVAELLLSSRSFPELFSRGSLLARSIRRTKDDLLWLRASRDSLQTETSMMEARRTELETLQEEKRSERGRIDRLSNRTQKEMAEVRKARERFERRQQELADSETKIQSLITRLEQERSRRSGDAGPGLASRKGRLSWPTDGTIIERFGIRIHPRFKTQVPSNGIDIAAPAGTPIRAVGSGIAEYVDWLPGYGRAVILNHGEGYYSLYAHCRRVLVAAGARVAEGQQIAEVGDTDSIRGNCLHFEIRQREKALNPEEWLQ